MKSIFILLLPFIGTTLGASFVFFMKNSINKKYESVLMGLSSGIMIASSIWSLIIPSIELSKKNIIPFLPPSLGFILGIIFLLILDYLYPNNKKESNSKMLFAITVHNIPEGMAVGVALISALKNGSSITMASAFALSFGIALQNIPEGAIVSMPLKSKGYKKNKSFLYGVLSGLIEPISGLITIILLNSVIIIMPYLLSFASGAMFFVVADELIPKYHYNNYSKIGTFYLGIGFIIMMILDISLG